MQKKEKNELLGWLKTIVVSAVFVIAIRVFIFTPVVVDGASMMPTYESGDRVIVNIIGKQISDFERFDVIVFEAKEDINYIKRIIGLPGDHIAYKDDVLYINGNAMDEPYLNTNKEKLLDSGTLTQDLTLESLTGLTVIPDGYLFVLGDNRRNSNDSRKPSVGLIPMEKVLGKTNIRIYPLENIGIVK